MSFKKGSKYVEKKNEREASDVKVNKAAGSGKRQIWKGMQVDLKGEITTVRGTRKAEEREARE